MHKKTLLDIKRGFGAKNPVYTPNLGKRVSFYSTRILTNTGSNNSSLEYCSSTVSSTDSKAMEQYKHTPENYLSVKNEKIDVCRDESLEKCKNIMANKFDDNSNTKIPKNDTYPLTEGNLKIHDMVYNLDKKVGAALAAEIKNCDSRVERMIQSRDNNMKVLLTPHSDCASQTSSCYQNADPKYKQDFMEEVQLQPLRDAELKADYLNDIADTINQTNPKVESPLDYVLAKQQSEPYDPFDDLD